MSSWSKNSCPRTVESLPATPSTVGSNLFTNEKSWKCGVAIHIKNDIKATQLVNSSIGQGEESIWAKVRLKSNDKLIIRSDKRYRTTPEGENYNAYAHDRNQVKWAVKRAVRGYEKSLHWRSNKTPKHSTNMPAQSSKLAPPFQT